MSFDQPWKGVRKARSDRFWGIFNANGDAKFS